MARDRATLRRLLTSANAMFEYRRCLIIAVLTVASLGCDYAPNDPMRLGTNAWPGYAPLHLAEDIGVLDPEAFDLVDLSSTNDLLKGLASGALDGGGVTLDQLLNARDLGIDLVVITVTNVSNGADTLIAQPEFNGLEQLAGKRVGCEAGALCTLMLRRAADSIGLSRDDFEEVPLSLVQHETAFVNHEVDAIVTFEPMRTRLLNQGGVEVFTSQQIPNEIIDVLVVTREIWNTRRDQVSVLQDAWFDGVKYFRENPTAALTLIDKRLHLGVDDLRLAFAGLEIPERDEVEQLLADGGAALQPTLKRLEDIMLEYRQISERTDLSRLFPQVEKTLIRER